MSLHQFGGNWTEEKLMRLRKYLSAYMTIFKRNPRARWYTTYYVDAFAGTGSRITQDSGTTSTLSLFEQEDIQDVQGFYDGSARIALENQPSFDNFVFVDSNSEHVHQLEELKLEYPDKASGISVYQEDANEFLQRWCQHMDWNTSRAVVFLDPYGMAVDWTTLEAIAATKSIDLWILLPVGQAINRMLTRGGPPEGSWADKLTRFFGTEEWIDAFYRPRIQQMNLFGKVEQGFEKQANFESIGNFFIERLEQVFERVAPHPLVLLNSKNTPIFMLYFAASNPTGAPTAVKIAGDILGR